MRGRPLRDRVDTPGEGSGLIHHQRPDAPLRRAAADPV